MRNRHFPRLCHACLSPMEAQEDTCWRCGVAWTDDPAPALRVIDGGAQPAVSAPEVPPVSTAERLARLVAEARA